MCKFIFCVCTHTHSLFCKTTTRLQTKDGLPWGLCVWEHTQPSRVARSPARRTHHTARPYYTPSKNIGYSFDPTRHFFSRGPRAALPRRHGCFRGRPESPVTSGLTLRAQSRLASSHNTMPDRRGEEGGGGVSTGQGGKRRRGGGWQDYASGRRASDLARPPLLRGGRPNTSAVSPCRDGSRERECEGKGTGSSGWRTR